MNKTPYFTEEEFAELQQRIDDGFISKNKHPEFPIYIYNYTKHTQFEWYWDKYTIQCRGLILHEDGYLISKGFDKFFTYQQLIDMDMLDQIPMDEPFVVSDKLDGSLGVSYFWEGQMYVATRGSFVSEMAIEANDILRDNVERSIFNNVGAVFQEKYTYMFEIIYPDNKIVVDYDGDRKLVLLAVYNNETRKEEDIYDDSFDFTRFFIELAERFDVDDWRDLADDDKENKEGYVVHFLHSDYRVKMKLEWYTKLAYMYQNFSKLGVWKILRDAKDMGDRTVTTYLNDVVKDLDIHDEFYPILEGFVAELHSEYYAIEDKAHHDHALHIAYMEKQYGMGYSKKDFAMEAFDLYDKKTASYILAVYNNKNMRPSIIREIRPTGID